MAVPPRGVKAAEEGVNIVLLLLLILLVQQCQEYKLVQGVLLMERVEQKHIGIHLILSPKPEEELRIQAVRKVLVVAVEQGLLVIMVALEDMLLYIWVGHLAAEVLLEEQAEWEEPAEMLHQIFLVLVVAVATEGQRVQMLLTTTQLVRVVAEIMVAATEATDIMVQEEIMEVLVIILVLLMVLVAVAAEEVRVVAVATEDYTVVVAAAKILLMLATVLKVS